MNSQRVLEFVSGSFERFPPKFKKFKNSLKLSGGTFLNLSDNLQKWHKFPKGRELTKSEQEYLVSIIIEWIKIQIS